MSDKLCIIDADSMINIVSYANRESDDFNIYKQSIDNFFNSIVDGTQCNWYLPCLSKNSYKNNLTRILKYKAKRVPKYFKFFYDIKQYIKDSHNALEVDGLEADDLLGILAKKFSPSYEIILSYIDKDLKQLPYRCFNYRTRETYNVTEDEAKMHLLKQMLIGDTTDNIDGCRGRGVVYAEKTVNTTTILSDILNEYLKVYPEVEAVELFQENYVLLKINSEKELNLDLETLKLCRGLESNGYKIS